MGSEGDFMFFMSLLRYFVVKLFITGNKLKSYLFQGCIAAGFEH